MAADNTDRNPLKVKHMKKQIVTIVIFCCLPLGCAAISEQGKMEEYDRTMDSYETAMQLSDFNTACQYVNPSEMAREDCLKAYENLKIVSYDVRQFSVAEDKQEVTQAVEVEYYFLDRYVVKKTHYEQAWQYQEDRETWLLQTGPPHFE
jgi:hypothetical protein